MELHAEFIPEDDSVAAVATLVQMRAKWLIRLLVSARLPQFLPRAVLLESIDARLLDKHSRVGMRWLSVVICA